jgi:hypothetical protein
MSFRSGQSGTVVRKGKMWHGRYNVDVPGEETRRKASVPLGSVHTMKKNQAKRKLRAMLEEMGLNEDTHLERMAGTKTFASEAAWWRDNKLAFFKPSCQETMGSHLDKYLLPRLGTLPIAAIDERRVQEFITDLRNREHKWPNGVSRRLSPKTIRNIVGVLKMILGEKVWRDWNLTMPKEEEVREQRWFTPSEMSQIIHAAKRSVEGFVRHFGRHRDALRRGFRAACRRCGPGKRQDHDQARRLEWRRSFSKK